MKKLSSLGPILSRQEMKKIVGGDDYAQKYCNKVCTNNNSNPPHDYSDRTTTKCSGTSDCTGTFTCETGYTASWTCS